MRRNFLLALLMIAPAMMQAMAEVERIEEPMTFRHAINWKSNHALTLGRLDMTKIGAEDQASIARGVPPRVAIARRETTSRNFEQDGEWTFVDDMSVWRLKIHSRDARWLSFRFDDLFLPSGSSLYVYNESLQQVLGPYTDQHNKPSGRLWTSMIDGDTAYVEINVPTRLKPYLSFDLKSVNHGYRSLKSSNGQKSGACNIDVVCPQGDGWRDQIRSVARYIFERNGSFLTCTGSMLNNTTGDRKPYFLTANHCVSTAAEAQSMVLFWNFETSVCGGNPDGSAFQSQSGATLLATLGMLDGPLPERDMTLVELDETPDSAVNVFYSGWDTDPMPPDSGVSIHHPDGDEKRISIESGPITKTGYLTSELDPDGTHLRIAAWDEGTTEEGSSGAGFWNSDRRLVGVLSGGSASCDNPNAPDYYAHLAVHYDVGTSSATRLKAWLDTADTGAAQVDGIEGCEAPDVTVSINPNPTEVNQPVVFTATIAGGTTPDQTYTWDFDGDGATDSTLASPTFTYSDTYIGNAELTVSSQACSSTASAAIVVLPEGGNLNPVANAVFATDAADEGSLVQLSGAGSSDPNGDTLTYQWSQTLGPAATLSDPAAESPTVTLPMVTTDDSVTFELLVTDIFGATDTAEATITVLNVNRPPVAIVSNPTLSVNEGTLVTLNAAASSDADDDALVFSWSQSGGTAVTLSDANTPTATFTAPQVTAATNLTFEVAVTDAPGLTDTSSVVVTINNVAPPPASGGGGGGGALGWPLIVILLMTRCRRQVVGFPAVASVMIALLAVSACSSPGTDSREQGADLPVTPAAADMIVMVKRDTQENVAQISDPEHVRHTQLALQNRERRYEKIKPLFEYQIELVVDGKTEVWKVSASGYIQPADSRELYRMDMSVLNDYMKDQ